MFKPTPNPPAQSRSASIDCSIADRALSHYNLDPDPGPTSAPLPSTASSHHSSTPENQEDTLVDIHSILQSAAATAYEHADNQTGANRKLAMGVVHLIELAQLKMDSVLDKQSANAVC
ncbi:DUF6124 family protein [Pseudomonas vanderleydeniana]|uniref:DUF3077 domain-containing protein n=1 Tax=Pseudomonas vanderleydeniana TaxID=2745495 RepID=A0A9E6TUM4_9PSED|nr:hypothetical protein [Pseudomonas vanderleydeniana]QXI30731.1 hypothetical protein HU752_012635 [Pseudomonas vanderleydeniana]